tara:strand:+ start:2265 stop:2615 length:351 start_codon:yes stop_codon:yes gene_type:complete
MTDSFHLCQDVPGACTCEESHRSKTCEEMCRTRNEDGSYKMILKGYYVGHGKDSDDPRKNWVHEMKQCENKGSFRTDCNGIFSHRQVLCEEHYPHHKDWNDQRCRICGSQHRSCCC